MVKMRIRKCGECDDYTMEQTCGCGAKTTQAGPPKYVSGTQNRTGSGRGGGDG